MAKKDTDSGNGGGRLDAVLTYASALGYEDAVERGEWKGCTVYELILKKDSEEAYTGIPQFVIDDGESELRIASVSEAFDILDSLDDGEEEADV